MWGGEEGEADGRTREKRSGDSAGRGRTEKRWRRQGARGKVAGPSPSHGCGDMAAGGGHEHGRAMVAIAAGDRGAAAATGRRAVAGSDALGATAAATGPATAGAAATAHSRGRGDGGRRGLRPPWRRRPRPRSVGQRPRPLCERHRWAATTAAAAPTDGRGQGRCGDSLAGWSWHRPLPAGAAFLGGHLPPSPGVWRTTTA